RLADQRPVRRIAASSKIHPGPRARRKMRGCDRTTTSSRNASWPGWPTAAACCGCAGRRTMNGTHSPIRILSVDDHPLLREGVASLLAGQADLKLVAEAANGREAVEQFRAHRPDVTLMDLQMPEMNGVEAMIAIRAEFPLARIIVLTTYVGDAQVLR